MMTDRVKTKQDTFYRALAALRAALADPVITDRDRAGVVQSFEFTYELTWKVLKQFLADQGHETHAARDVFKKAFSLGFIDSEQDWLSMIEDRNLTTHTYDQELAREIIQRIESRYMRLFELTARTIRGDGR